MGGGGGGGGGGGALSPPRPTLTGLPLWPPTFADAASKHATQAFFDCLRAEVEQHGVEVTVISPGYIHTHLSLNALTADGSKYGGEARLRSSPERDSVVPWLLSFSLGI